MYTFSLMQKSTPCIDRSCLSQDPDLKRCFGVDGKINECNWSYLETLRTIRAPHEALACLQDLLVLFRNPKWQSIWLMLDVKVLHSLVFLR